MAPKISVITINFNNSSGFKNTFQSVIEQDYPDLEFLVIDGGSTDGSQDFLFKNSSKISFWLSEKDSGVYDAMNKGIRRASGDYLLFLNSGDHFVNHSSVSELVKNSSGEELVYGNLKIQDPEGSWIKAYPSKLNFRYFYFESLPHPASLISKKLFEQIGEYDVNLKIAADWKFFLLAVVKYRCSYKHVDSQISVFYRDGMSSNPSNQSKLMQERVSTLQTYFRWYYRLYSMYLRILGKQIYW